MNEIYTKKDRVYQRQNNIDSFEYSDGNDTEHYLQSVIDGATDLSISSSELPDHIRDWPTKYHLSPQRADLLRPFEASLENKSVLEIGCGCGAITRFLGEAGANVTALDGSLRRSKIAAARCRDLPNVTVVCDNFHEFRSSQKFDFIILIGVLEYSYLFSGAVDSAHQMLLNVKELLHENGSMIVAIENKLGLKYWAGAPEDHIGKPYFGLENQYNLKTAETYGRLELQRLLHNAGFPQINFLYPFPDYKLPSVILTEEAMDASEMDLANLLVPAIDRPEFRGYHPKFMIDRVWKEAIHNGLAPDMSNSFLVVASPVSVSSVVPAGSLAFIYSSARYSPYRKANTIVRSNDQFKVARRLVNYGYPERDKAVLKQVLVDEKLLAGNLLYLEFQEIVSTRGWTIEQLAKWTESYFDYALSLGYVKEGRQLIDGGFLDLTPFNIVRTPDGGLRYFDQEWIAPEELSLEYLMFRGLYFCFARPLHFMPPASGTTLDAFELIGLILKHLMPEIKDASTLFCKLESRYFGPVSAKQDFIPGNFDLNIFPADLSPVNEIRPLAIHPLNDIVVSCLAMNETGSKAGESPRLSISLSPERNTYKLGLNTSDATAIVVRLSELPGMIRFYSCVVKGAGKETLAVVQAKSAEPMSLTDIISIAGSAKEEYCVFTLFEGKPSIQINIPPGKRQLQSGHLEILLELAIVEQAELSTIRHSLRNLLSVDKSTSHQLPGHDESTRNQLADLIQRLSKNARADLEEDVAVNKEIINDLEATITDQQSEIERLLVTEGHTKFLESEITRLNKTIEWFSNTYEKRSLPGIVITKLKSSLKGIYLWILHTLLKTGFVTNRYALKYMLEYTRDNGAGNALRSVRRNFEEHGFKTITNARALALDAMKRAAAAQSPVPAQRTEEVYPPEKMEAEIAGFRLKPLISVIMPTYNTKPALLELAINSVRTQIYHNWELCIIDDGSSSAETRKYLDSLEPDPRIRLKMLEQNGGISTASNQAIQLSTGEYLALFDHDDELTPDALFWVCKEINEYPDTDIIYSDECKKDEAGAKSDYFIKPDWSPQLLFNMMYVGHLTVYRKSFLTSKVGEFRSEYDFSQDYDLILRATEQTSAIRHIGRVLYYWRQTAGSASLGEKPYARETNIRALADAIQRRKIDAEVINLPTANRVKVNLGTRQLVSIVIPTDSPENLSATIDSIAGVTTYENYEIVPVTNSNVISQLSAKYQPIAVNYVRYDMPYNFSDKCNAGARGANGQVIIFLNDDVRPLQADWIENTIEYLSLPGVGGTSPKLIYEDDTIQYAGMVTGVRNLTGTSFHCYPRNSNAYINFPQLTREVSILSGACLAMRKQLFLSVGGFDAVNTPSAHSDVDLSFKIIEAGYRCIYTPYAELRHIGHLSLKSYEEKNAIRKKDKADIFLVHRWPSYISYDPYFPPAMRDLLYHDSPEPLAIHAGKQKNYQQAGKDIILVCHDLTRSGAPIMLYNIATVLLANDYFVVLFCAKDGPLKSMYEELGITVIIDPLILQNHNSFERFAINFDYILCNTVVNWPIVRQMQDKVKTIWWLQEAKVIDHFINARDFVTTLSNAKHIIGVSDYSLGMIRKYNRRYTKIYNACYDFYKPGTATFSTDKAILFTIVGSVESRKGHDILFHALDFIKPEVLRRIKVNVVGRVLDPEFSAMVRKNVAEKDFITFTGEISNSEAVKLVAAADVIVCPSRDDPFPVVLVEGFCMAKTCIVSDATGFAELITQGENGFVFHSEAAEELAGIMTEVVLRSHELPAIGARARAVYEEQLSIPVLEQRLLGYLNSLEEPLNDKTNRHLSKQKEVVPI